MGTVATPHVVVVLAYPGMSLFETGIVTEVFGVHWPGVRGPRYQLVIAAEEAAAVSTLGGGTLRTPHGLEALASANTVIIPSVTDVEAPISAELAVALQDAHARGARIASICTGAFALAGAGLLDGRRATTHWVYADRLRARFPEVEVDPQPLFIDHGDVLTSAGSASGLDLCLHLVRQDHGPGVAKQLARRLVAPPYRDGGQTQYIEAPDRAADGDDPIAGTMAWALEHLDQPLTLDDLAAQAHMAPRTYLRHFTRATATSPVKWLIAQRVEASLALLEGTSRSIEEIATAVGFQTAVTYRHHFTRHMDVAPSAYRRSFQGRTTERAMTARR